MGIFLQKHNELYSRVLPIKIITEKGKENFMNSRDGKKYFQS